MAGNNPVTNNIVALVVQSTLPGDTAVVLPGSDPSPAIVVQEPGDIGAVINHLPVQPILVGTPGAQGPPGATADSNPRVVSIVSSAAPSINADVTDMFEITALAANITGFTVTGTFHDSQKFMVRITDNGSAKSIVWGSQFLASGVAPLLTSTSPNRTHTLGFMYDGTQLVWICLACDPVGYV